MTRGILQDPVSSLSLLEYELFLREILMPVPSPEPRQTTGSNSKRETESAHSSEKSSRVSSGQMIRNQIPQSVHLSRSSIPAFYASPEGFQLIQRAKEGMDQSFLQQKTRQEELLKARRDKVGSDHPDQQAEGKEGGFIRDPQPTWNSSRKALWPPGISER